MSTRRIPYQIPAAAYALTYARRRAGISAAVIGIPALTSLIAGYFDIRWWIVGLMWLLIAAPIIYAFGWYSVLLKPEMILRQRPQQCFLETGRLKIEFYDFPAPTKPTADAYDSERISEHPAEPELKLHSTLYIPLSSITSVEVGTSRVILNLQAGACFDFLILPTRELSPQQIAILQDGQTATLL